jgi:hypothetical protein
MKKNKLTLQPRDYIVLAYGLKIENVGNHILELDLPSMVRIYPVPKPEIKSINIVSTKEEL